MTVLTNGDIEIDTANLYLRGGTSQAGQLCIFDNGTMRPATHEEVELALDQVAHLRAARRQVRRIAH